MNRKEALEYLAKAEKHIAQGYMVLALPLPLEKRKQVEALQAQLITCRDACRRVLG